MLLLHCLPNLDVTPENAAFRKLFYSKWGREHCIISARARRGEHPLYRQRLSIKAAWGETERYYIDGRTLGVDDDNYLVLNDLRHYGSVLASAETVHSFSIFFRPGFAEETLGGMWTPAERSLEHGPEGRRRSAEFAESLRSHDQIVSPVLRFIAHQVDRGLDDAMWYEEQLSFLLERMFRAQRAAIARAQSLPLARPGTRNEICRRIGWSLDDIHTPPRRSDDPWPMNIVHICWSNRAP